MSKERDNIVEIALCQTEKESRDEVKKVYNLVKQIEYHEKEAERLKGVLSDYINEETEL